MTKDNNIYNKPYDIKGERTGGSWNETITTRGEPVLKDGKLVGGRIKMSISHHGNGGGSVKDHDFEDVTLERWQAYVDKAIAIEERRAKEKEAQKIENEKVASELKRKEEKPVNAFMDEYIGSESISKKDSNIYNKPYDIKEERTGGSWNETITTQGKPVLKDGKLVGGRIKMSISHHGNGGGSVKDHDFEDVTLKRWQTYVDKAIAIEERRAKEKEAQKIENEKVASELKRKEEKPVNAFMDEYIKKAGIKR